MAPNIEVKTNEVKTMTYDEALAVFLRTRGSFGGGLSNHGPMASEALAHMGADRWIGPFVASYRPRLKPREAPPIEPTDETDTAHATGETPANLGNGASALLNGRLPELVDAAAAQAGHGLLRVAHAVRAIERGERDGVGPDVRIAELRAALRYWGSYDAGLPVTGLLAGDRSPEEWGVALGELATFDPLPGLLTGTLALAARQEHFAAIVTSLAPSADVTDTLDDLALLAVAGYLRNHDLLSWFALLHGVTVSTMARVLVPHLDPPDQPRLVASVAGFVAAAIIGFDRPFGEPDLLDISGHLADRAGATLDDHTIKFTDACIGLAERGGRDLRCTRPNGKSH